MPDNAYRTVALSFALSRSGSMSISTKAGGFHRVIGFGSIVSSPSSCSRLMVFIGSPRGNRDLDPTLSRRLRALDTTSRIRWSLESVHRLMITFYALCLSRRCVGGVYVSTIAAVATVQNADRIRTKADLCTVSSTLRCLLSLRGLCQTVDV